MLAHQQLKKSAWPSDKSRVADGAVRRSRLRRRSGPSIPNATASAGEDDQCSSTLSSSMSQYTQREKQDSPIQHTMHQSSHN
ncbi:unnamed protein product [Schistosoma mattheei]|uniref:Uncharacterized protein n=1 Tax=Schistosoma mattheei TaxID=31246 RepID=A0A183PH51_9TREM|nr:unnamed protein product [Schistosoma mattheei]